MIICDLRWKEVTLPASVSEADLDAIIFSKLKAAPPKGREGDHRVDKVCEEQGLPIEADDVISARIRWLADVDRIESFGDVRKWRHSEICSERPAHSSSRLQPGRRSSHRRQQLVAAIIGVEFSAALMADRGAARRRRCVRRYAKRAAHSIGAVAHPSCGESCAGRADAEQQKCGDSDFDQQSHGRFPSCSHAMAERE